MNGDVDLFFKQCHISGDVCSIAQNLTKIEVN